MFDLSVVICAHNPRVDYLRRTLASLQDQTLPFDKWELLIVDNASATSLADSWDLSWQPRGRHVMEPRLGLSAARQRAIMEARSDLLVFVDDDNVLDRAYLATALAIKRDWPILGAWGSAFIIAEYELQPDPSLARLLPQLAVRQSEALWSNVTSCSEVIPWGAGLCMRSNVAEAYVRMNDASSILISGRRGKSLLSGEDNEIAHVACQIGLGIGVFPELRLIHLIPKERVSRKYLLKLHEGTEISSTLLAYKWHGTRPPSPFSPWGLLSILKNSIVKRGLDRQLYFSWLRAVIAARRIIKASEINSTAEGPNSI